MKRIRIIDSLKIKKTLLLIFSFSLSSSSLFCQGSRYYANMEFQGFGIGIGKIHNDSLLYEGFNLIGEFTPKNTQLQSHIYAVKFEGVSYGAYQRVWGVKFLYLGYQFALFSNMNEFHFSFIPKAGIGYKWLSISNGRDLKIWSNDLTGINKNIITAKLLIPFN